MASYAATEPGNQCDTSARSITLVTLVTLVTLARGLYVGISRGRDENLALVATGNHDQADAREFVEHVIANERDDVPALSQQRQLGRQIGARCPPTSFRRQ